MRVCDEVHYFEKGRYLASGSAQQMLLSPEREEVRRFVAEQSVAQNGEKA